MLVVVDVPVPVVLSAEVLPVLSPPPPAVVEESTAPTPTTTRDAEVASSSSTSRDHGASEDRRNDASFFFLLLLFVAMTIDDDATAVHQPLPLGNNEPRTLLNDDDDFMVLCDRNAQKAKQLHNRESLLGVQWGVPVAGESQDGASDEWLCLSFALPSIGRPGRQGHGRRRSPKIWREGGPGRRHNCLHFEGTLLNLNRIWDF